MREIKFKVRDKVLKTMITDDINISLLMDGRVKENYTLVQWYSIKESLIPLQYTWLKDKNWKEIYEGDIISFKRLKKENVPVVFIDDGFKISVKTWPCSTRTTGLNYLLSEYQCEVIWNIYENQELLK